MARYLDDWDKEAERIGKELAPVEAELEKLEALASPGPDDNKRMDELKKKREACRKRMNEASMELRTNLMLIEPLVKADEKELVKLPAWLKEIIKKKGIPLGDNIVITPDVEFDFVATMGCGDTCPYVRAPRRADWTIPDPKHLPPDEFRAVRDLIRENVRIALAEMGIPGLATSSDLSG